MNPVRRFSEFLLSPVISIEESCLFLIPTLSNTDRSEAQENYLVFIFKPHALKTGIYWDFLNQLFCNLGLRKLCPYSLYF